MNNMTVKEENAAKSGVRSASEPALTWQPFAPSRVMLQLMRTLQLSEVEEH
ncbi:hypothetical protein D3C78_1825880 [compost metagenome]